MSSKWHALLFYYPCNAVVLAVPVRTILAVAFLECCNIKTVYTTYVMDIEWLQKICLAWPATEEEVKWEHALCFMVAKKMFCLYSLDEARIAFKVAEEDFDELSQADGFIPAPYLARAKWVCITQPAKVSRKDLQAYLRQSYDLIRAKLPKKVKAKYGL